MANWLDPSILLGTDTEAILGAIKALDLNRVQIQKYAAYYLSKTYTSENQICWHTVASKILAFYATSILDDNEDVVKYLSDHADWLSRIKSFRSATRNKQVTRDCVCQLIKSKVISVAQIATDPMLLASLAHAITVHEFMSIRIDGMSPISYFLNSTKKPPHTIKSHQRVDFFQSLHQAYKSDFTYIISPDLSELEILVDSNYRDVFKFFDQIKAKFIAVDFVLSYAPEFFKESLAPHYVPDASKSWPLTVLLKTIKSIMAQHLKLHDYNLSLNTVWVCFRRFSKLFATAFDRSIKTSVPAVHGFGSFDTTFPMHDLPRDIIEAILLIDAETMDSVRSLFCVSRQMNALKRSIKWRDLMKRRFPLKTTIAQSTAETATGVSSFDWTYFAKHLRYDRNIRNNTFLQLKSIPGWIQDLDDDIFIGCVSETEYSIEKIYWAEWQEVDNKGREFQQHDLIKLAPGAKAGIISWNGTCPRIAVATDNEFSVFEGSKKIHRIDLSSNNKEVSLKRTNDNRFFVQDNVEVILTNDRLTCQSVFSGFGKVLDTNMFNGQILTTEGQSWTAEREKFTLRSKDYHVIGHVIQDVDVDGKAVFLDEFNVVGYYAEGLRIGFFDTRKLGEVYDEMSVPDAVVHFDAVHRRMYGAGCGWPLNVYSLESKEWLAVLPNPNNNGTAVTFNSRYVCLESPTSTHDNVVYDWQAWNSSLLFM